jgi:cytoskeletal protein RodZ
MKIQKKSNRNRLIVLVCAVLVFLLCILAVIFFFRHRIAQPSTYSPQSSSPKSSDQKSESTTGTSKSQSKESLAKTESTTRAGVESHTTTDKVPLDPAASINITKLEQANRNIIYQATVANIRDGGICSATYESQDTQPIVNTVTASSMTCGPVSIPEMSFTKLGKWKLTLRYFSDNKQVIATKEIEVR